MKVCLFLIAVYALIIRNSTTSFQENRDELIQRQSLLFPAKDPTLQHIDTLKNPPYEMVTFNSSDNRALSLQQP